MARSAEIIYQLHLDAVSEHLWGRNFDALAAMMSYPHRMVYGDRMETVEDAVQLARTASVARDRLGELGATAYHRACLSAEFDVTSPERIIGRHQTFVLCGGTLVVPPYLGRMTLVRDGDAWLGLGIVTDVDPTKIMLLDPENSQPIDRDDL